MNITDDVRQAIEEANAAWIDRNFGVETDERLRTISDWLESLPRMPEPANTIRAIPLVELLNDKAASKADIEQCSMGLLQGLMRINGTRLGERIDVNQQVIEKIDAELERRNHELERRNHEQAESDVRQSTTGHEESRD